VEGSHNRVSQNPIRTMLGGVSFLPHHLKSSQERLFDTVKIALVGKYTDLKDSYMSVMKALEHSVFRVHRKLILEVGFFSNFIMLEG
jgi:hypothetical protein